MSSSSRLLLCAAVLLAALVAAAATSPAYCVPGQAIPRRPLLNCRWYVSTRTCGGGGPFLAVPEMKRRCCLELAAVVPECRCKALRSMMDEIKVQPQECWYKQAEFAATVVTERECGLRTIHGGQFCYDLGAEY
uniref:Alpha-amylase inhibitor-5 n=1 Tax=Eleusine coracana subsp. coracana TaxID=191504 RepID=A0A6G8MWH6_ELECO|nr:alpha-amylase inhibitor-5 [Eleusine coracana subsp. coracana]